MTDPEIASFISAQTVATICTSKNDLPWCFHVFYCFMEQEGVLVFKCSGGPRHEPMREGNPNVAGAILPATINFAGLQGVQFEGVVLHCNHHFAEQAAAFYHEKFPIGKDMPGTIWAVELISAKLTDNTKGFGYKMLWEKHAARYGTAAEN